MNIAHACVHVHVLVSCTKCYANVCPDNRFPVGTVIMYCLYLMNIMWRARFLSLPCKLSSCRNHITMFIFALFHSDLCSAALDMRYPRMHLNSATYTLTNDWVKETES